MGLDQGRHGKGKQMNNVTIEKATQKDVQNLTSIMKKTFDLEAERWLSPHDPKDFNIQPPGYDSKEMNKYMIQKLTYLKVLHSSKLVGGVIVTITSRSYGRIDRIFIDPDEQGKGIGQNVLKKVEEMFPNVKVWELETSSRQERNHHVYEKMGYRLVYRSEYEFCYEKRINDRAHEAVRDLQHQHAQLEQCDFLESEGYGLRLNHCAITNSSLAYMHFSNCNMSHVRFQNINLQHAMLADLNMGGSEFWHTSIGGVSFKHTNLGDGEAVSFQNCDLQESNFKNCNLQNVSIEGSNLSGMKINGILVEDLLSSYVVPGEINRKEG